MFSSHDKQEENIPTNKTNKKNKLKRLNFIFNKLANKYKLIKKIGIMLKNLVYSIVS
jgi:hypothetical protein